MSKPKKRNYKMKLLDLLREGWALLFDPRSPTMPPNPAPPPPPPLLVENACPASAGLVNELSQISEGNALMIFDNQGSMVAATVAKIWSNCGSPGLVLDQHARLQNTMIDWQLYCEGESWAQRIYLLRPTPEGWQEVAP